MNEPKVLLTTLSVRTSKSGRPYVTGWLGKAKLVGFAGAPDKWGNQTIDLYLQQPVEVRSEPRPLATIDAA